jgi:hypothetical protein
MKDDSCRTGPAVEAHYQFINWLMPTVARLNVASALPDVGLAVFGYIRFWPAASGQRRATLGMARKQTRAPAIAPI